LERLLRAHRESDDGADVVIFSSSVSRSTARRLVGIVVTGSADRERSGVLLGEEKCRAKSSVATRNSSDV